MADRSDPGNQQSSIFTDRQWAELAESLSLSPRQTDVVKCLFRGCGAKQIARHMGVSVSAVRTHLVRMFLKLDVADRIEIILCVLSRFLDECRNNACPRM